MGAVREDGVSPSRSRRCDRGRKLQDATVGNDGKARQVE